MLINMDCPIAQVSTSTIRVILEDLLVNTTPRLQLISNLFDGHIPLRVERHEKKAGGYFIEKVSKEWQRALSNIVPRTIPVHRYTRNLTYFLWSLIVHKKIKHEIVRSVRMLVVRRIDVDKIVAFQFRRKIVRISSENFMLGLIEALHWSI